MFCRRVVWGQPDDLPGVVLVPSDAPVVGRDAVVAAHAPGQRVDVLGRTVLFLARRFSQMGDGEDLDAAAELHDLTVALGEEVWEPASCTALGRGAAELFAATGDEAFLATTERVADLLCETQRPDGSIGDTRATAIAARFLREMADAVDDRRAAAIDEEPEGAAGGEPG